MSFKHRVHISIFASALLALLTTFLVIPSANANGSVEISCTGDTYTVSTSTFNATSGQDCEGTLVVDGSVLSIGSGAFNFGSLLTGGLRSVTIPNSVTVIGASAFFDSPLTSLTLGNSIIDIGDSAFASTLVTSLTIPNSVELIGPYAFYSAPLTSLTIPASVTTVGELAFHSASLTCLTNLSTVSTATLITAGITNAASLQTCEAVEAARFAAITTAAEAARKAKEQRELTEILALIPKIGELTLSLGETTKSLYSTKCVKGKTIKYVNKGSKCPKGYVKK